MNKLKAAKILAKKKATLAPAWDIATFLFKEQLDFIQDPARFASAVCSVRAGKTTACAADLIDTAMKHPGTTGIYITPTRSQAERIVWPELLRINREYKLGFEPNRSKLWLKHPVHNTIIYLLGANHEDEIDKVRGLSNVALVYLDECQLFRPYVKELVENVVTKRLYDTNGRCRLIGTPGPIKSGYFYDISSNASGWSNHRWTMFENPFLFRKSGKTPQQLTEQDCAIRGVTLEHPSIQRENFGRWAYDPEALLLQYNPELNHYEDLPTGDWRYILGIDLGFKDSDSLTVIGWVKNSDITYLVEELVTPNQKTDDLAAQIMMLRAKYSISDMPTDAGGLGKKIVEDLKARYGLPLLVADKAGKMANYKHLNNALRTGIFKAKKDSTFASDCNLLERDDAKSTPDRIVVKGHSDAVDSCLYAFKLSPAYAYVPPTQGPKFDSPEWIKAQEKLHLEGALEKQKKQRDALAQKVSEYGSWSKDKKGIPDWNKW